MWRGKMGQALYGEATPESQAGLTPHLHRLKPEGPAEVLADLRALTQAHPDLPELADHLAYLEKREAQMQSPAFQAAGWPIGSGAVESGNRVRVVVEARLKGSGMHGARSHVDPMLALRNIVGNDPPACAGAGRRSSSTRASGTRRVGRPVNRNDAKRARPLRWTGPRRPRHFRRQRAWPQTSPADQTAPQRPRPWSPHRSQRPRVGLRRIIRGGECPLAERHISLQDHERLQNFNGYPLPSAIRHSLSAIC
jgi:hypothetical protein